MKINYQLEMEKIINGFGDKKPKLLLHSCCAPCSSYVLEYLSQHFQITVLFYNPNLIDEKEFEKRFHEQVKINKSIDAEIQLVKVTYNPNEFYDVVKGFEQEPEGGKRCEICFKLRLEEAAAYADEQGFDYFTTSLSISPLKDSQLLNSLGIEISKSYTCQYLPSDFKKKNGYKRSVELSNIHDLYRQDYCGCIYSKLERNNQL